MTRTKRGYIARRRRTKMRSFASNYKGARSRLKRTGTQQNIKASVSAHRDRKGQKRDFRRLWISRINAAIRWKPGFYLKPKSYCRLITMLYMRWLGLNRKMLSQITTLKEDYLFNISDEITREKVKYLYIYMEYPYGRDMEYPYRGDYLESKYKSLLVFAYNRLYFV